ncbi:MAG: inositol monophosphatase family protein [Myxococcaceae bacterium]
MSEQQRLLQAVQEVAEAAGQVALRHYRTDVRVERKVDRSPVTIADREAEGAARALIERLFPQDGIIGEELGAARPDARRRWIVDPIDGTRTFVRGVPLWGTLVAVVEGETVLAGCAAFPAVGEWIAAARGEGAWHCGQRAQVSAVSTLTNATLLTTDERFPDRPEVLDGWRSVTAEAEVVRTWGDCYGYLLVATGRAELMFDPVLADWDSAALEPIVVEAGGVFTDLRGRPTAFGKSAVATNAALAEPLRATLLRGLS